MKQFVIRQNIQLYRELLETVADEANRKMLETLLAEEEAKLAELIAQQPPKAAE